MIPLLNLQAFCSARPSDRFAQPWVAGGWRYACNGSVAVRLPTTEPDSAKPPAEISGAFASYADATFLPWPVDRPPVMAIQWCQRCEGERYVGGDECPDCKGEGEKHCHHCGHTNECKTCHGVGEVRRLPCPACKGAEEMFEQPWYRVVGRHNIHMRYDRLIVELPNPAYCEQSLADKVLLFRFDGGEGFVMGLTIPKEN